MESSASHPWYHLDNAAMMYSAIQREDYSALYRFSAVMTQRWTRSFFSGPSTKPCPGFPDFR